MKTPICDMLGIDIPLLAFSHCRDVVAAVTNAGGFGVLGASSHTPEQLEMELAWIDEHVDGKPYGADIIVPEKYEGKGQDLDPDALRALVPAGHRAYVRSVLAEHGIDLGDQYFSGATARIGEDAGEALLDVAFRHPIKLIANALGVPTRSMFDRAKAAGVPVAALVGSEQGNTRSSRCAPGWTSSSRRAPKPAAIAGWSARWCWSRR